jgi:hypothetical protein
MDGSGTRRPGGEACHLHGGEIADGFPLVLGGGGDVTRRAVVALERYEEGVDGPHR